MAQFDVCRLHASRSGKSEPRFVLVMQCDLMSDLYTTIVAPLADEGLLPELHRLRPIISVSGKRWRVIMDRLSVISRKSLGDVVGSVPECEYELRRALDIVFLGV